MASAAMQLGQKLAKPKTLPEEREAMNDLADNHGGGLNEGNLLTLRSAMPFASEEEKKILSGLALEETRDMLVGAAGIKRDPKLKAHFGGGIAGAIAYGQFVSQLATEEEVTTLAKPDVAAMRAARKGDRSLIKDKDESK